MNDDYARGEARRMAGYKAAFESPAYKRWVASLTPAQRETAESRGLLRPHEEAKGSRLGIDELPPCLEPQVDGGFDGGEGEAEASRLCLDLLTEEQKDMLSAFLQQGGNPRLRWACLRYLLGYGTCLSHAKALGMRKQAFHYHVRQMERQLGLPPMANQRSESVRDSYRLSNRRRG